MAQPNSGNTFLFFLLFLLAAAAAAEAPGFLRSVKPAPKMRRQKLSHLRFYWHDVVGGPYPTVVRIAQPLNSSSTSFGGAFVIDDPLTEGPELSSKPVGRAQGVYVSADKEELGLLMAMTFTFTEERYNGSALTVLGRNPVRHAVREMPVVGGSGRFRLARGYCQVRTYKLEKDEATVEYNVYVIHY